MKTFTAVLLALAFMVAPPAFAQPPDTATTWQVSDPNKWINLIDKHTPPITQQPKVSGNGHFCHAILSSASTGVAQTAAKKQLWWVRPPIVPANVLGRTRHFVDHSQILINWDHPGNSTDYWKAMTMAHEGLHAHFGPEPFTYSGNQYTSKKVYVNGDSISEGEALIREIIEDCFEEEKKEEEDPQCGEGADCGGGETPEPVCELKLVEERYTAHELQERTAEVCYNYRTFGGHEINTFCVDISFKVYVEVEKTRLAYKMVCEN